MTQEKTVEYNKKCAKFLGWKNLNDESFPEYIDKLGNFYSLKNLLFNSDWNWIMEVVGKIQTLDKCGGIVLIQQAKCKITSRMLGDHSVYADVSNYLLQGMKGQKEAVVEALNQFLTWYEQNNKS